MLVRQLIILLQQLPPDKIISIPFPFPDKDNLLEYEPFVLSTLDGALLIPQPMGEIFMSENPEVIKQ